jgi:hypothetical protein
MEKYTYAYRFNGQVHTVTVTAEDKTDAIRAARKARRGARKAGVDWACFAESEHRDAVAFLEGRDECRCGRHVIAFSRKGTVTAR